MPMTPVSDLELVGRLAAWREFLIGLERELDSQLAAFGLISSVSFPAADTVPRKPSPYSSSAMRRRAASASSIFDWYTPNCASNDEPGWLAI